jgi:Uri superfamily endonuclease
MMEKITLKGTYCLLISLKQDNRIKIGKLGNLAFSKGYYVYIGSALNSLHGRLNRHLRDEKKLHWHVDYFLANDDTEIIAILYTINDQKLECKLAREIAPHGVEIYAFGCSDCKCDSHLFFFKRLDNLEKNCKNAFKKLDLTYKNY